MDVSFTSTPCREGKMQIDLKTQYEGGLRSISGQIPGNTLRYSHRLSIKRQRSPRGSYIRLSRYLLGMVALLVIISGVAHSDRGEQRQRHIFVLLQSNGIPAIVVTLGTCMSATSSIGPYGRQCSVKGVSHHMKDQWLAEAGLH